MSGLGVRAPGFVARALRVGLAEAFFFFFFFDWAAGVWGIVVMAKTMPPKDANASKSEKWRKTRIFIEYLGIHLLKSGGSRGTVARAVRTTGGAPAINSMPSSLVCRQG